jgi:hypothetical protein
MPDSSLFGFWPLTVLTCAVLYRRSKLPLCGGDRIVFSPKEVFDMITAGRCSVAILLPALIGMLLIGHASSAQATVLAGWDFNGLTNGGTSPLAATTSDAAVSVSGLTSPFPGTQNAGANTFGSNNLTTQAQATAIQFNSSFNFEITTTATGVSLSNIGPYNIWLFDYDPTSTPVGSIFNGLWQYSIDGTNFANIGSSFSLGTVSQGAGNPQSAVDLTGISALQSMALGTAVDFRLVAWGAAYGANYAGFNSFQSGDDLIVNGTVPVPEPSTCAMALAGLACGGYSMWRRRKRA